MKTLYWILIGIFLLILVPMIVYKITSKKDESVYIEGVGEVFRMIDGV